MANYITHPTIRIPDIQTTLNPSGQGVVTMTGSGTLNNLFQGPSYVRADGGLTLAPSPNTVRAGDDEFGEMLARGLAND